jgi:hypothetical protein
MGERNIYAGLSAGVRLVKLRSGFGCSPLRSGTSVLLFISTEKPREMPIVQTLFGNDLAVLDRETVLSRAHPRAPHTVVRTNKYVSETIRMVSDSIQLASESARPSTRADNACECHLPDARASSSTSR